MAVNFLEADIEKMIYDNRGIIHDRGFVKFYAETKRQFVIESGRIDLVTYEDDFENTEQDHINYIKLKL